MLVNFETALNALKKGGAVHQAGWNGVGLTVHLQRPDEHSKMTAPYAYLKYPDGQHVPWVPSQTDLLTEDWEILL